MHKETVWSVEAARNYDTPGVGMFAPGVVDPAVDRLVELAGSGRALEFGIGTGRVGIPLARRGVPVVGVELSGPMIDQLRTKIDESTLPVVHGDMATATAPGAFQLVYVVFNSLSNLLTQEEQVECFRNAAQHLTRGGCFVVELGVPALRELPPGQSAAVFDSGEGYLGVDTYDVVHQHLTSHHVRFDESGQARVGFSHHRYIWPAELDLMARMAGFALESRHSDWHGGAFTAESTTFISVYRLPAPAA